MEGCLGTAPSTNELKVRCLAIRPATHYKNSFPQQIRVSVKLVVPLGFEPRSRGNLPLNRV